MSFPTRKVGSTDVSAIAYGAMGIGGMGYGKAGTDEERFKLLDRLVEMGCVNWDTASVYGDSEELIGKWFAKTRNRSKIFLATKFGLVMQGTQPSIRGDPEFIQRSVATSLRRLQTDHIDLLYQHRTDGKVPIEVTVGAMAELVKQGKVKYLGLSEASPSTMRRAAAIHPISALQVEYSPFELALEAPGGALETARELEMTIFAYSPTGRGLATGRYKSPEDFSSADDIRQRIPKFSAANFPRINNLVTSLAAIAAEHGPNVTPGQICIAWLLAQGPDIIPIPGSKQISYTEENIGAKDIKLSDNDVKRIRNLCEKANGDQVGDRYSVGLMNLVHVETPELPLI